MDIIKVFGSNVRKYRTEKKISQERFAELCGLHRTYISDIECFRRSISLDNIQKIADALEVSIFEFLDIEIKSISDILSLLNKMNDATSMNWSIDDNTGKVSLSFEMSELNKVVCDYMLIKNDCSDTIVIENQKADLDYKLKSLFINSKTVK